MELIVILRKQVDTKEQADQNVAVLQQNLSMVNGLTITAQTNDTLITENTE